jgi:hypothetical protein
MRSVIVPIVLLLSLCAGPAQAVESEFQISPRFGRGELRINEFKGVNEELEELDTFGLGVAFGYLTPIGVVFNLGHDSYGNFDLFNAADEFNVVERFLSVGYQFELGDGWRLVPQVGRARWKLTSEEGQLFHPGMEDTRVLRGYEYFWEVGLARRVNRVMALGLTARSGDYGFGRARSLAFVMSFGF